MANFSIGREIAQARANHNASRPDWNQVAIALQKIEAAIQSHAATLQQLQTAQTAAAAKQTTTKP